MAKAKVAKQAAGILGRVFGRGADDAAKAVDEVVTAGRQLRLPGFGSAADDVAETVVDVATGTTKPGIIRRTWGRTPRSIKYGLPALAGGGAFVSAALRPQQVADPLFDPSKIETGARATEKTRAQTQAALDAFLKKQEEIIRQSYATPGQTFTGAEVLNPVSAATNQMGAATLAEMQRLAARAAQDAGDRKSVV